MSPDEIVVVKIGGSTMGSGDTTLADVVALSQRGVHPVVVHGGGNRVTEWLKRTGAASSFVRGKRVTDAHTLEVVLAVLAGIVNKELVARIMSLGGHAVGLSGIDGGLIRAESREPELGYVGEVTCIDERPVRALLDAGYIPVIATSALNASRDEGDSLLLNVNGDTSAAEMAIALQAARLIFLTDVPGVRDSDGNAIAKLSRTEAEKLMKTDAISGGMIPKLEACLRALATVPVTHIVDGRSPGALHDAAAGKQTGTTIMEGWE